jgi:cytochrome P450
MGLPKGPGLPAAIQTLLWVRRPIQLMRSCRARFGRAFTVRISGVGNVVFLSDPEAIRQLFTGDQEALHAGSVNAVLRPLVGDASVLLLDGEEHLRHRKLLLPPFHGERMRGYAGAMRAITERVTAGWGAGATVVLRPAMQRITLEVILRVVFGFEQGPELDAIRANFERMLSIADSAYSALVLLPAFQRDIPGMPWRRFLRDRRQVDGLIYDQISQRRGAVARGERRDGVLDLLLEARDEAGTPLTDSELRDELMTLLIAGHETTATALCWTIERILSSPPAHGSVLEELDRARAPGAEAAGDPLGGLDYLDATIKEALRSRPILPIVGRRLQRPLRVAGADVDVEAGTVLAPCVYLMHHDPEVYPEPDVFRPERFLGRRPDPHAWLPFGGGIRRCLGMAFALYEMKLVLASVLSRFHLELVDPHPARTVRRTITFAPRGGVAVRVAPRPPSGPSPWASAA